MLLLLMLASKWILKITDSAYTGTKVTDRTPDAIFRRRPQIFADSPLLLEIEAFEGCRKPQKAADFRRKLYVYKVSIRVCSFLQESMRQSFFSLKCVFFFFFFSAVSFTKLLVAQHVYVLVEKLKNPQCVERI